MITYDLSTFSPTPFGRYLDDGKFNATKFRTILTEKLIEAKENNEELTVDLDGITLGIGSSFLEEAFGGLVRKGLFTKGELIGKNGILHIKSKQKFYQTEINSYIEEAKAEKK